MSYRDELREIAFDRYGLVTTKEAELAGVPAVELRKLAARGALTHRGYGIYRYVDAPVTNRDQFAEAVLLAGDGAYLTHDAVLAFHELALVNPRRIRIGTPRRVRATLPSFVEIIKRNLPAEAITEYEGVRSTTVAQALADCQELVMPQRLAGAASEARLRGLITSSESKRLQRNRRRLRQAG